MHPQRNWFVLVVLAAILLASIWAAPKIAILYHQSAGGKLVSQVLADALRNDPAAFPCLLTPVQDETQQLLLDRAIRHLETALEKNPGLTQAALWLGRAYCLQGQPENAVKSYLAFTDLRPDNPLGHLELGFAYEAIQDFASAISQWETANLSAEEFLSMGYRLQIEHHLEEALQWYQRAELFGMDLSSSIAYTTALFCLGEGDNLRYLEYLSKAVQLNRGWLNLETQFTAWFRLGQEQFKQGDYIKAAETLKQTISFYPEDSRLQSLYSEAYRLLGETQWQLGDLTQAAQNLQMAFEINKDNIWAHIHYGKVVYLMDSSREAETQKEFRIALQIQPLQSEIWLNLIEFWIWNKNEIRVMEICQQAVSMNIQNENLDSFCNP